MRSPWYAPKYGNYTFAEIWPSLAEFLSDYNENIAFFEADTTPLDSDYINTFFFLMYAKYGNSPIANNDVNQFKFKLFSYIFAYGPMWQKKQKIQEAVRGLSEDELLIGSKQIYNHAFNPSATPSTETLEELTYINDQNTANHKKSKMEAYSILWELLHANATEEFLRQFKKLFSVAVGVENPLFYIQDEDIFSGN